MPIMLECSNCEKPIWTNEEIYTCEVCEAITCKQCIHYECEEGEPC